MERIEKLKQTFLNRMYLYPGDAHYIQRLSQMLNLPQGQEYRLYSIMGGQELSDTLPLARYRSFQYMGPGHDPAFRFNLHMHTTASDGRMDIQDLLDEATAYANQTAQTEPEAILPAFTIAITDHDCLENLKPALDILTNNVQKYQNLRVVLGAELGAVLKDEKRQRIPLEYELIYYALDPFDEKLNAFLTAHQLERFAVRAEIFKRLEEAYPAYHLSMAEAMEQNALLRKDQGLGYAHRIYHYATSKIPDKSQYGRIYDICFSLNHTFHPPKGLSPYQETDDIFNLMFASGFGFLGIAHPQKIQIGHFIGQDFSHECLSKGADPGRELLNCFLIALKNKGLRALEINYQFDAPDLKYAQKMLLDEIEIDPSNGSYQWLKLFADYADKYGMLKTGGYDSHHQSIMTR